MKNKILFFYSQKRRGIERFVLFSNPYREIICLNKNNIKSHLISLDQYIEDGYYIAGFISYETGGIFNDINLERKQHPYFYFGIYKKPKIIEMKISDYNRDQFVIYDLKDNITFDEYEKNIKKIKRYIKDGETYQINYCFKKKFKFAGDGLALFLELLKNQKTKYSAFIKYNGYNILSLSPELFFEIDKEKITMKPMKGTVIKGDEDINKIKDEKNLAENIMIVDLIRNDLGKICKTNSIKVPKKFTVEKYKTLYQMTSTITGRLKNNIKFSNIIESLFPSGSVTGAPKRRSMQIINLLEKEARGIYTGSIGYFSKDNAVFNICIRTPVINIDASEGEIGIGSGIVYDSDAQKEYKECQGKSNFFSSLEYDFKIFESILYKKNKGCFLLDQHLDRMEDACIKFDFEFNRFKLLEKLNTFVKNIKEDDEYKIRIFIDINGNITIDGKKIKKTKYYFKAMVSDEATDSSNIFFRYKTTKREFYDRKLKKAKENGFDEVIFFNEKGELTEGATSNIFVFKNGIFYTPPVCCGLLNGTLRQVLLETEPEKYKEKILYKQDLQNADGIFLCNSVRGLREVKNINLQ